MGKQLILGLGIVMMVVLGVSCGGTSTPPVDPCKDVTCSNHGTCTASGETASCTCVAGYHAEGLSCVLDEVDPCEGITCSSHGTCTPDVNLGPICTCDTGYHAQGLNCISDTDPCSGITCSGHGTCAADTGSPVCTCEANYYPKELFCINPCEGQTCGGHGACSADENGDGVCTCDAGYHPAGLNCEADINPCDGVTCSGHGTCAPDGDNKAACTCDGGYHPVGLDCVSDTNVCDGMTCCGHGTCTSPTGTAQCGCDAGFHNNATTPTVCSPDQPGNYPPAIDTLFNGTFTGGTCALPACDLACGEPGFDPASTWNMDLAFKTKLENPLTTCSNTLVVLAKTLLTDAVELNMNFQGNCMVSSEGGHIGTAYNGAVTLCRFDTVADDKIDVWETGVATCNGDTGNGVALVYLKDTFNWNRDCQIYAEAAFAKQ